MDKLFKFCIGFILITGIVSLVETAQASSTERLIKKGNSFFESGKYDEAISAYDEAAVDDPESPIIYFNKGTALYKKEDYTAAREAFGQAALKTKDILLEAKSKYNLGACFFREGERQKDSDLKKTLESYGSSVQSFQEALSLDPDFTEAAENIELVRLMMKAVLDEIKKQEEDAQKNQEQMRQVAEQIKKLIEKQKNLLNESQSVINNNEARNEADTQPANPGDQNSSKNSDPNQNIADSQEQLKNETQNLSEQLRNQAVPSPTGSSGAPPQEHPSKQHLEASVGEQEEAINRLSDDDFQAGADHQQKSLDDLNKALEAMNSTQNNQQGGQQQGQGQKNQQTQQRDNASEQTDREDQDQSSPSSAEREDKPQQNQQPTQAFQLSDDANNIIDEEKENKKQRMPLSPGGFKKVDKDW